MAVRSAIVNIGSDMIGSPFWMTDGINFSQMRICHMYAAAEEIQFAIYACSPEESSFTATFTDMRITECAWKAHDGQQPD